MTHAETRSNLILALVEAGQDILCINAALAKVGQGVVSEAEVIACGITLPAAPVEAKGPALAPTKATKATKATKVQVFSVDGHAFRVVPKLAVVDPTHGLCVASIVADQLLSKATQFLAAALGDEWYAAYKGIKSPGHTTPTPATREAAYAFAVRTLLALNAPVVAARNA